MMTGTQTAVLEGTGIQAAAAVSTDGRWIATGSDRKSIVIWDLAGERVREFDGLGSDVTALAVSPDGRNLLVGDSIGRCRMIDAESGRQIWALKSPGRREVPFLNLSQATIPVWSVTFSENGETFLTVGGTEARIWEVKSGKTLQTFLPQSAVASVHFSPSGDRFVTGSWDNAARIWDTNAGIALNKLGGAHTRFVNSSVFSPDGQLILTASDDRTAGLWNAETGQFIGRFSGHEGRVTDAAFSPDGLRVLTASDDHTVRIWDTKTFQSVAVLSGHSQAVLCAKYSPDGEIIASGSDDTSARLWSADTGEPLGFVLDGHTASVTAVAFSPDSRRVFTGSKDTSAKLWDPETGKEILTLSGHTQEITTVTVSPSGDMVLTAARDGTAILWPSAPWNAQDNRQVSLVIHSR